MAQPHIQPSFNSGEWSPNLHARVDIDKYKYLDYVDAFKMIFSIGLKTVPVISENYILSDNIDELVELSKGKSIITPKVDREGIVIRPLVEKIDLQMSTGMSNARVSFKSINPEYLLLEVQ